MNAAAKAQAILHYNETTRAELKAAAECSPPYSPLRREWATVRTFDWLAKGAKGEPPSFGSWLLVQTDRDDDVGLFAREYDETTLSAVARTTCEVAAYYAEMGGFTAVGRLMYEDACAEFLTAVRANGWRNVLRDENASTSTTHALYRFFGAKDRLLYIGLTLNPGSRWKAHGKNKPWWHEVCTITIELYPDRASVEAAERWAIKRERPFYNVVHNRSGGPVPDHTEPPRCRCETCLEYADLPVRDRPEWNGADRRLTTALTVITQARLGLPHDWWDWSAASHCDLERAVKLLPAICTVTADRLEPR